MLAAMTLCGGVAVAAVISNERQRAHERERETAARTASDLGRVLQRTVSVVRGADGLAADGVVDPAEFTAFAADVLPATLYTALAHVVPVADEDRESFESETGLVIRDRDGFGGFVDADRRSRYLVVVDVHPDEDPSSQILGFDVLGDDVRRRAVEQATVASIPVISDMTSIASGVESGLFVVTDVRTPSGAVIGYIASAFDLGRLLDAVDVPTALDGAITLYMDGAPILGGSGDGSRASFVVNGRDFEVAVDDPQGISWSLPAVVGALVALVVGAAAALAVRDLRHRERMDLLARQELRLAELGQLLAEAPTTVAVIDVTARHAGGVLDADLSTIVGIGPDGGLRHHEHDRYWSIEGHPIAESARHGVTIAVPSSEALRVQWPSASHDPDVRSLLTVPLCYSSGQVVGACGFAWADDASADLAEQRERAGETIADLVSAALERTSTGEAVTRSAEGLARLGRALTSAATRADVESSVDRELAGLLGVRRAAMIDLDLVQPLALVAAVPTTTPERLALTAEPDVVGPGNVVQQRVLETVADLVGQTLARVTRSEDEHRVILAMQELVIGGPDPIDGFDIAVRYQPALELVGLGGDFCDVAPIDDERFFVVVGDISGHGADAIIVMAELQALLRELLASGMPVPRVLGRADQLLARRSTLATVHVIIVDRTRRVATSFSAGHPPPIAVSADGETVILEGGRRPLLGVRRSATRPLDVEVLGEEVVLDSGTVIVLYTDGLIERRTESVDVGIERLRRTVAKMGSVPADRVVDDVMGELASDVATDDVAMVAVRVAG